MSSSSSLSFPTAMAKPLLLALLMLCLLGTGRCLVSNGEPTGDAAIECPLDCHCHRDNMRVNWVTDCSESNLTEVPQENLSPSTYVLNMNGNNVKELKALSSEVKLRELQMAHNHLTELTGTSFVGMAYLIEADFSYNDIRKVDPEAFKDSSGLIRLELQNNPLAKVDGPFLMCRSLLNLDLSNCGINALNAKFFQNTTNLNTLDLSHNPLGRLEPGPFEHLANLEYLKLSDCSLATISPDAFRHLENLRELEMDDNDLRSLDWKGVLTPLVRLEHLDLRRTRITDLPGDAFARNLYLRQLVLADNELQHLNVGSTLGHNLHSLQSLDLSNCNLQDRLSEETFRNASNMRLLNLSGNPMFAGDLTKVLRHLPKLHKLSLSNCSLRRLPEAFEDLEHLEELDISHNPLADAFVGLLKPLRTLEYLDMSYCKLGYVGNNTFALMTSLKKLIMSGNALHKLEQGLFANLTRLASLELQDCGLKHPIDPSVFGDRASTNIIELKLGRNPLNVSGEGPLLPKQLANLEILDLSHCELGHLHKAVFKHTRNLTSLNLSNNRLANNDSLVFLDKLQELKHLDLSNNNLTTISPRTFNANTELQSLNLMGNPFVCNCSLLDTWNWALKERSNLELVGSQPSQFTPGSAKLRKSLSCSYDPETYRGIIGQQQQQQQHQPSGERRQSMRKGDATPNRTWAKYIRESQCDKRS